MIQSLSENLVLVVLPPEPDISRELNAFNDTVSQRCDFDVIVDFSRVEILTSPSVSNLIILNNLLRGSGHRLALCNISFATRCIFNTLGLGKLFVFAADKQAALAALGHTEDSAAQPPSD